MREEQEQSTTEQFVRQGHNCIDQQTRERGIPDVDPACQLTADHTNGSQCWQKQGQGLKVQSENGSQPMMLVGTEHRIQTPQMSPTVPAAEVQSHGEHWMQHPERGNKRT